MSNWLRYWFCGWNREDFDTVPKTFLETKQRQSLDIYTGLFEHLKARLRKGGVAVFHLGRSKKCDMAKELVAKRKYKDAARLLVGIARGKKYEGTKAQAAAEDLLKQVEPNL